MRHRILIVEDHPAMADGLCRTFDARFGFDVLHPLGRESEGIVTADRAQDLISDVFSDTYRPRPGMLSERPDVALVDITLAGSSIDGIELVRWMAKKNIPVPAVIFTMHPSDRRGAEAYLAGAAGYLGKEMRGAELRKSMERVLAGERIFPESVIDRAGDIGQARTIDALTNRQREVVGHLRETHDLEEIAGRMGLSRSTVYHHIELACDGLGIPRGKDKLMHWAASGGWIGEPA